MGGDRAPCAADQSHRGHRCGARRCLRGRRSCSSATTRAARRTHPPISSRTGISTILSSRQSQQAPHIALIADTRIASFDFGPGPARLETDARQDRSSRSWSSPPMGAIHRRDEAAGIKTIGWDYRPDRQSSRRSAMNCRMRAARKSISVRPGPSPSCRSPAIARRWCGRKRRRRRNDCWRLPIKHFSPNSTQRFGEHRGALSLDRAAAWLSLVALHRRALHRAAAGAARRCRACRPSDRRARAQSRLARCSRTRRMQSLEARYLGLDIGRECDTYALQPMASIRYQCDRAGDRRTQPAVLERLSGPQAIARYRPQARQHGARRSSGSSCAKPRAKPGVCRG